MSEKKYAEMVGHDFTTPAQKADQMERLERLRNAANSFALLLEAECPFGKNLLHATTHLEECVNWASRAITRGG